MAIQTIGLGTVADDGTGDTLRIAGDKINDNFNDVYTTLGDGTTLTAPAPTANPTFTGTITGVTADLSGNVTIGGDLALDHDGAVLSFGADSEISFTHVHDTGILLNSTSVIQFNDASQNIGAPNATTLDINATDEIELNATLVDINANLDVSGTYTGAGLMTTGGNIVIPDAGNIGSASDTDAIAISSGGAATFSQRSVHSSGITVADGGQIGSASDTDAIAIASTGVVTFSQQPSFPVNTIGIDQDARGPRVVIEAGGTDGAGANAGDNIIIEDGGTDGSGTNAGANIACEIATDIVGVGGTSTFNLLDSAGVVVKVIVSV